MMFRSGCGCSALAVEPDGPYAEGADPDSMEGRRSNTPRRTVERSVTHTEVKGQMSVHEDLGHARHALDELVTVVDRIRVRLGNGPDVRRARADADHLREDLDLLRQSAAAGEPTPIPAQPRIVFIPRTPDDPSMWVGCDDEGIGSHHGPERRHTRPAHRLFHRDPGLA